jgi:hypothetical protein
MKRLIPRAHQKKVKIITNMGEANVSEAIKKAAAIAKETGIEGLTIAGVFGSDITDGIDRYLDSVFLEFPDKKVADVRGDVLSADVLMGAEPIVDALRKGADIVVTGRCCEISLFLAPLIYEFGWADGDRLAAGALAGQLLKNGAQVTGGYFASGKENAVSDLWNIGFPVAEVDENGHVHICKTESSGGRIDAATCTEQLLFQIGDPKNIATPDVTADFSGVTFRQIGENAVSAAGAKGKPRPATYDACVGYRDGYLAKFEVSFGGPKCLERAQLSEEILEKRAAMAGYAVEEWRCEYLGINSLFNPQKKDTNICYPEVRLRTTARVRDKQTARYMFFECGTLSCNGPAAGGGRVEPFSEIIAVANIAIRKFWLSSIRSMMISQTAKTEQNTVRIIGT